jgi:hypothetical protein
MQPHATVTAASRAWGTPLVLLALPAPGAGPACSTSVQRILCPLLYPAGGPTAPVCLATPGLMEPSARRVLLGLTRQLEVVQPALRAWPTTTAPWPPSRPHPALSRTATLLQGRSTPASVSAIPATLAPSAACVPWHTTAQVAPRLFVVQTTATPLQAPLRLPTASARRTQSWSPRSAPAPRATSASPTLHPRPAGGVIPAGLITTARLVCRPRVQPCPRRPCILIPPLIASVAMDTT